MASPAPAPVGPETPISIRVTIQGVSKKFKLPLADLVPQIFPGKLRAQLNIPDEQAATFERFSDSSASFVNLDPSNVHAYKTLYRAAKAKLKLRLRATLGPHPNRATVTAPALRDTFNTPSAAQIMEETFNSLTKLNLGSETTLTNVPATTTATEPHISDLLPNTANTCLPSTTFNPHPVAPDTLRAHIEKLASSSTTGGWGKAPEYIPQRVALDRLSATHRANLDRFSASIASRSVTLDSEKPQALMMPPPPNPAVKPTEAVNTSVRRPMCKKNVCTRPSRSDMINAMANVQRCPRNNFTGIRTAAPAEHEQLFSDIMGDKDNLLWSVYCNACDKRMVGEHYHCNICENGDYDLCTSCMARGIHCPGENHWLIKRCVQDDKVVNSTTETMPPKPKETTQEVKAAVQMPGAFTEEKKVEEEYEVPTRTCNCCVKVLSEHDIVNCLACDDYDLCLPCLENNRHGHHPGHTFDFVYYNDRVKALGKITTLCSAGRGVRHAAICDGCDKTIFGTRHKCQDCPDWDYCSKCIVTSKLTHPRHRFAAIHEPLPNPQASPVGHQIHTNIYCDGPLCGSKNRYITGVRFKCAVCPDVDFCENCEASPYFGHNRTHPLLKFQTPVRGCSITTMVGDETINGPSPCGACETLPQTAAPAKVTPSQISQIRTIADVKPSEPAAKSLKEKIEIKDLLAAPIPEEKVQVKDLLSEPIAEQMQMDYLRGVSNTKVEVKSTDLQAYFIRDTVPDGSTLIPGQRFVQVWTLRNPGPHAWPVGCSVRYVGGDNMLNVDDSHPSSANDIAKATESNVIRHTVEVGEEMAFRVLMKAPKREGVAISYWRLKAADGTPFGHRLWCHINVVSAAPASSAERSEEVPAQGDRTRASLRLFFEEHEENSSKMKEENAVKFQDLKKVYDATKDRMVQLERAEKTKRLKQMLEDQTRAYQEQLMHMDNKNRDELSRIGGLNLDLAERRKRLGNLAKEAAARSAIVNNTSATAEALVAQVETVPKLEAEASNAEGSAMIFPILEKESPASSTHQDHIPTNSAETENVPAVASPTSAKSVDGSEFFEDAESVSLVEDSDDESSGFLTDEEYDILDASDEELA